MPTITSITPSYVAVGESVTIGGTGFGAVQGGSTVTINGTAVASYTSWADTLIVVVVGGGTTSGHCVVTVSAVASTNNGQSYVKIRETTLRSIEDLVAQDESADSSPEDKRVADAAEVNDLANLINNTIWRGINDFRLSLTTALSVTTADVTGATTIYFTPYKGNRIALFNGRVWEVLTSAEVSIALGTITADKNYDIFAYNVSGTLTLEMVAWTNDTTRATALARQDGVWCKSGSLTKRYVGSFRTTATTTTEDSRAKRFLFNADNRVRRNFFKTDSTSHTYATGAFRQWNNATGNQIAWLQGLAEDAPVISAQFTCSNDGAGRSVIVGIGVDNGSGSDGYEYIVQAIASAIYSTTITYNAAPALGYHFAAVTENGNGVAGTQTFYDYNLTGTIIL